MQTQPIGVKCPRCEDDIMCTVEVRLLTGHRTDMRLVDLADRFAEHYVAAGHVGVTDATRRSFGINEGLPGLSDSLARFIGGLTSARRDAKVEMPNAVAAYAHGEYPTIREAPGPGWRELAEGSPNG